MMHEKLLLEILFAAAGVCIAVGGIFMILTARTLRKAICELAKIRRGPEVNRDGNGRPYRERL